jgi:chromosome segregation ATPase
MRLTTITISGFKSFSQKTVIDVRKNITGIVGPNGSGKSNIAEAVRFVLGEQSMKSMRTPVGSDLIFKGSGGKLGLPALSRASVSLTLSNKEKEKGIEVSVSDRVAPFLVYDEIVLAREIYADGTSDYMINGAKVRLKDVEELLALAGIGNNKHAILNQGEADKVLLVSLRERRLLVEDALGLKVFQLRIDETRKKLEKTHRHLQEVRVLEKEIKPHFDYLKRQLEKIKKFEGEKERFREYAKHFFSEEKKRLVQVKQGLKETGSSEALVLLLETLEKDVKALLSRNEKQLPESAFDESINLVSRELLSLETDLRDKVIALELIIHERRRLARESESASAGDVISYKEEERLHFRGDVFSHIDGMKEAYDEKRDGENSLFMEHFEGSKLKLNQFLHSDNKRHEKKEAIRQEESRLKDEESLLAREKEKLVTIAQEKKKALSELEQKKNEEKNTFLKEEKKIYIMRTKSAELRGLILAQKEKERSYEDDVYYFESLLEEAKLFLGDEVREYPYQFYGDDKASFNRYEARRALEKSKLRLEEGAVSSGAEIESEYRKVEERLVYLNKEIEDIVKSEKELVLLITQVETHMEKKYREGIESVSASFAKYFSTVFPGGEASLAHKEELIKEEDEEGIKERGVEIRVKLPDKKVKSIAAFSGGEKALTAIALLFALSEVSPPPFIVLDETDAPLDEHNAKKYGETLALLSEKSKLLVITHNRETMSHCEMLYGVTIGMDGASKLLSVDLK